MGLCEKLHFFVLIFPLFRIFGEDKLHLGITFSCEHESSTFDLYYLCFPKIFERDMLTFISCAKTMSARTSVGVPEITVPYFQAEAVQNALDMGQFSAADLERLLRINSKIAAENYLRYQDFFSEAN